MTEVEIRQLRLDKRGRHAGKKRMPYPTVYLKDVKRELRGVVRNEGL